MSTFLAWSTDPELRRNASSGGFVRAMLRWMLETNVIDRAIIARTGPRGNGFRPECVATDDPEELADRRTASVYYPVSPLSVPRDKRLLYAATLLPCQVETLRKAQAKGLSREIGVVIELLCHHTPRPEFVQRACAQMAVRNPATVYFRGNGWPGEFTADGTSMPYLPTWGRHGATMLPRCRACTRTCGPADWTVADPWGLGGDMGDGKTLVHAHTCKAWRLAIEAKEAGAIEIEHVDGAEWDRRMDQHAKRRAAK